MPIQEDGSPREPYFTLLDKIHYWRSLITPTAAMASAASRAATQVPLQNPSGIAVDQRGNVYIADRAGLVWRIDRSSKAEVFAGTRKIRQSPSRYPRPGGQLGPA